MIKQEEEEETDDNDDDDDAVDDDDGFTFCADRTIGPPCRVANRCPLAFSH